MMMLATWIVSDNGAANERYGSRYVAKLISDMNGMVYNETYPSNDMDIIVERINRSSVGSDAPIVFEGKSLR